RADVQGRTREARVELLHHVEDEGVDLRVSAGRVVLRQTEGLGRHWILLVLELLEAALRWLRTAVELVVRLLGARVVDGRAGLLCRDVALEEGCNLFRDATFFLRGALIE